MKQYFSIFALSARSTLAKLMGIIVLMGIVQTGLFYFAMKHNSYGILLEDVMTSLCLCRRIRCVHGSSDGNVRWEAAHKGSNDHGKTFRQRVRGLLDHGNL